MIGIFFALLFIGLIIFWGVKYNFALPFNTGNDNKDPPREPSTQAYRTVCESEMGHIEVGCGSDGSYVNPNDSSFKGDYKLLKKFAA